MKQLLVVILMFLFTVISIDGQQRGHGRRNKAGEKIKQLEKLKLIEVLELDEETTLRFFSRREKHRNERKKLHEEKKKIIDRLEDYVTGRYELPDGKTYFSFINDINKIDRKIMSSKKEFLESLTDLLSEEKIAKYVVFQNKFFGEIRDLILDKRAVPPSGK